MSGDASDSSDDSEGKTNEKPCTVKHQITNGKTPSSQLSLSDIHVSVPEISTMFFFSVTFSPL